MTDYKSRAEFLESTILNLANLFEDDTNNPDPFHEGYAKGIKLMAEGIKARISMVNEFYPILQNEIDSIQEKQA